MHSPVEPPVSPPSGPYSTPHTKLESHLAPSPLVSAVPPFTHAPAVSLPTPVTPTLNRSPAPSVLSFTPVDGPPSVAWLQSKGFDTEIQRAFQENDITGDALIELDGLALKDKLGVTAFGKRMRLLKQIGELKREDEKAKQQQEKENSKEKLVTRPTSLVLSPSDGALATRGFWDWAQDSHKDERGVLSKGESSHKPDITKAKQFFDQAQPTPTTTIKTDTKTDPSEAGLTPISSFPPSP
ncbi:polar growth protein [Ceratobasidium sp. 423]|nr:polar growth protein [Ceratobasidium sp. 423]